MFVKFPSLWFSAKNIYIVKNTKVLINIQCKCGRMQVLGKTKTDICQNFSLFKNIGMFYITFENFCTVYYIFMFGEISVCLSLRIVAHEKSKKKKS